MLRSRSLGLLISSDTSVTAASVIDPRRLCLAEHARCRVRDDHVKADIGDMSLVFGGDAPEIPGQGMDAAVTNAAISGEAIGGHGNGSSFYIRSNAAMAAHPPLGLRRVNSAGSKARASTGRYSRRRTCARAAAAPSKACAAPPRRRSVPSRGRRAAPSGPGPGRPS